MIALALLLQVSAPAPLYKDARAPIEARVQDLLSRMTPEEKFWQLYMTPGDRDDPAADWSHGVYGLQVSPGAGHDDAASLARRINALQHYFIDSTRLGIPILPFEEALHGIVRSQGTVFPQAIALAATWDTALMGDVATEIASETGSRGIRQVLSPVINLASDVRWGRTEETYGEDPFLSAAMGVSFIGPFEAVGIVTTPKHLIANVGEGGRDSYPIEWNERELRERFLPPFAATIGAGARSVMSAYNSVGGLPATQNPWLLTTLLRHDWGFRGVVISDAAATGGATVLQLTEEDTPHAAAHAWEAGLDVVFQTEWKQHRSYLRAIQQGLVAPAVIDTAVARVLRLKFSLGLFDHPYVDPEDAERVVAGTRGTGLARQAAREAMVLLKNRNDLLPLRRHLGSIAVIGPDAVEARFGGYSGPGTRGVSILEGIRENFPHTRVTYVDGPGRTSAEWATVPASALSHPGGEGLQGEYFSAIDLSGAPAETRIDPTIDFGWTLSDPAPTVRNDWYSIRWSGTLTARVGLTALGVEGDDGYRLWLDGRVLIDRWTPGTSRGTLAPVHLVPRSRHSITLEFHSGVPNGRVKLIWDVGADRTGRTKIAQAVSVARRSEVAIVVAGIEEGEFRDRSSLALPGHQEELIRAVAATGRPTIVVLVGGSAITMSRWLDQVDAVVMAWYPGQEGGHAVARLLDGDLDPAGRLPITFPVTEGQLPLYYDHRPTGRGDDYVDGTGEPLFPFGFGLSYTRFEYADLVVSADSARFRLTNAGPVAGDEVPQLYIHDEIASTSRPVMQLRGFTRVHLAPGETRTVSLPLPRTAFQMWGPDGAWIVEPGTFRVMVGASSRDIRLQQRVTIQ